jgi:hypothetical protein
MAINMPNATAKNIAKKTPTPVKVRRAILIQSLCSCDKLKRVLGYAHGTA